MTRKLLAFAGALVLTTTCLSYAQTTAQTGTTIVPDAPAAADPAASAEAPTGQTAAPAEEPAAAAEPAPAAPAGEPAAAAQAAPAAPAGEVQIVGEVDDSPSADTQAAGNAPTPGDLGKSVDPAGNPVYSMAEDGTADWYTWRGYKKYGANCLACHGPDGAGSSFAPNLTESLENLSYFDFAGIVVSGQQNQWRPHNSIMPAWGEDPNVMCSLDAIYIYLRARADGVVGRGEPKRPEKNEEAQQAEYDCLGF